MQEKKLKVRELQREYGSQAKLARETGIGAASISRIMRGLEPPYPNRARKIADALHWEGTLEELFSEVDE